jgi:hypothetical protein
LTSRPIQSLRYLAALALGFVGGVGVVVAERFLSPPPTVAALDVSALVAERVTRPDVLDLPEAARLDDAARFATQLEREVRQMAREHGALLIAAPAVLAGAPDLTDVLRARLARRAEPPENLRGKF